MAGDFFPTWTEKHHGVIAPDERLPMGQTAMMGVQHVIAMFGATILGPLLMGFDPNVAILMSGIGTLLFFVVTAGRVPSYLGSSFAFIGPVAAATAYTAAFTPNPNVSVALGGIVVCGVVYFLMGVLVHFMGTSWIEKLMPPVVTGAVVAVIGLNLAGVAVMGAKASSADAWYMMMTVVCIAATAVFGAGMIRRLLILVGLLLATLLYVLFVNVLGWGVGGEHGAKAFDFSKVSDAPWWGVPTLTSPVFDTQAIWLIAPIAVILIAENLGHLRAISGMMGKDMNPYMGRAFMGDGLATALSGFFGGTGVTTYAENIGVMAVTKIYSTLAFVFAGVFAILLGFSPKVGALIASIPAPVLGGVSIVVFGLIAVAGAKIWVDNKVDFSKNHNLIVAAVTLIVGAGNMSLHIGSFELGGIGVATFGAIILYAFLRLGANRID
ncbi:permease [Formosimonas limnophila]|uniref:Permease n=1 Tax=Formosimonas limnophila TaxID=1384487 RepID=A0A8J3CF82_9BURK|nr:solute carrier family 23 protein [Formosimonas limnophila]GHA64645.1 permease [Formosimonas limnophila]